MKKQGNEEGGVLRPGQSTVLPGKVRRRKGVAMGHIRPLIEEFRIGRFLSKSADLSGPRDRGGTFCYEALIDQGR